MGLFTAKKAEPTLAEIHAAAELRASQALNLFHAIAGDLHAAAEQQADVAAQAQDQINQLTALRDAAAAANAAKVRQAQAVVQLVS